MIFTSLHNIFNNLCLLVYVVCLKLFFVCFWCVILNISCTDEHYSHFNLYFNLLVGCAVQKRGEIAV